VFNPFTEVIDESTDFDLIFQAKKGNRDALEKTGPQASGMDLQHRSADGFSSARCQSGGPARASWWASAAACHIYPRRFHRPIDS
jgi:hypothetical protein